MQQPWWMSLMGWVAVPGFCTPHHAQPVLKRFGGHCCSTKCLCSIRHFSVTGRQTGGMSWFNFKITPLCGFMSGIFKGACFQWEKWIELASVWKAEDWKQSCITCLKVFRYWQIGKKGETKRSLVSTKMTNHINTNKSHSPLREDLKTERSQCQISEILLSILYTFLRQGNYLWLVLICLYWLKPIIGTLLA